MGAMQLKTRVAKDAGAEDAWGALDRTPNESGWRHDVFPSDRVERGGTPALAARRQSIGEAVQRCRHRVIATSVVIFRRAAAF